MGFSDLISRDKVPEDNKKKYAEIITTKGEVLLNLINDLIDVSMIESGQLKIRKKKTDPQSIMEELYLSGQQLLHQYEKDHIDLRNNTNEQNLSEFHTDPYRLQQILSNLLQNAIKYTTHGTIELGCELQNEGRQLLFYVKDTGIGIPEEKKAYVFQRFTQLANKDGVTEGTGLGLAISGSLAELLGGTIDFKSDQHGTLFYVILPYKE
jgi:signal transduction histidine kinase